MPATPHDDPVLLPDAGPLITLAYADALDLLLKPGWRVTIVDMVFHELTRQPSPTRQKLCDWVQHHAIDLLPTQVLAQHQLAPPDAPPRKAHLGEFAIQEAMNQIALAQARIESAAAIERQAVPAGRAFSGLRFPP